jgi:hypothetical protein
MWIVNKEELSAFIHDGVRHKLMKNFFLFNFCVSHVSHHLLMTMMVERRKKSWQKKSNQSARLREENLFPQSIDRIFHFSCHTQSIFPKKPTPPNNVSLIRTTKKLFSLLADAAVLPFLSLLRVLQNYTVYRHINTFNSLFIAHDDDTMHTQIQLTIIWLDVHTNIAYIGYT